MVRVPVDDAKRADGYVAKYMGILGIEGEPPAIKWFDDPKPWWLGRMQGHVSASDAHGEVEIEPRLELQKILLKVDPRQLERTIAHEMVHVRDFLGLDGEELARRLEARETGAAHEEHPPSFFEGAARINAVMGPGFVTKSEVLVHPSSQKRADSTSKFLFVLGAGGLGLLIATLLRKRREEEAATSHRQVPPTQALSPREDEHGHRRKTQVFSKPHSNERGHYGK